METEESNVFPGGSLAMFRKYDPPALHGLMEGLQDYVAMLTS